MTSASRRAVLGSLAFAATGLAGAPAWAGGQDGHAAGYDVAPSADHLAVIPRRTGDAIKFTAALDGGPIKATTGGWARDITTRGLPIATSIAGAHLYLNAGGVREMHWHDSAEWACILAGRCQVTVVDPEGETEVANYAPGDLWYFPKGHSHAIQALGSEPCHAILAFDDGLYGEHGTFGLSDWISRLDAGLVAQATGLSRTAVAQIPPAEVYIRQGEIVGLDSAKARAQQVLDRKRTHRYQLMAQPPRVKTARGTIHVASAKEYPIATALTGVVTRLRSGAMHEPHWHVHANEWHYVAKGKVRVTLFAPDKRLATAEMSPGECAYIPRNCGHSIQNIGPDDCELIGVLDSDRYQEATLADWMKRAPRHLLANNLGLPEEAFAADRKARSSIIS
jgi:oxalate decarboxylase